MRRAAYFTAFILFVVSHHASEGSSAEIFWAEPFVVRTRQLVSLRIEGRQLPEKATIKILKGGTVDRKIKVLNWERQTLRLARLSLEIEPDVNPGLRGMEAQLPDGTRLHQKTAFRIAGNEALPWPHESPGANPSEIETLRKQVFVINNFGLYQGSDHPLENYFHDGLDIVLPKGTPIFALADGVVRHVFLSSEPGSRSIAIEDSANPGFGWIYVHTDAFRFAEGDLVGRGAQIAEVADFNGLEHIHLSRTFVPAGKEWNRITSHYNLFSDDFFDLRDTERPLIDRRLFLFKNESSERLTKKVGRLPVASGDVDLVIGIRDPGHYARSKDPAFPVFAGDRLAPAVIRCDVLNSNGEMVAQWTRDMTRTVLRWQETQREIWAPERVAVVFKPPQLVPGGEQNGFRTYSYYILTNTGAINSSGEIKPSDSQKTWRTAAVNRKGERLFPDGRYTVRISAWDSVGNRSTRRMSVEVRN